MMNGRMQTMKISKPILIDLQVPLTTPRLLIRPPNLVMVYMSNLQPLSSEWGQV